MITISDVTVAMLLAASFDEFNDDYMMAEHGYTNVTGVDYSAGAVQLAKSIAIKENLNINFMALVAPIGKVFPKASYISVGPDETLDLTTVSLTDKYNVQFPVVDSEPTRPKPLDDQQERKSDECCSTPNTLAGKNPRDINERIGLPEELVETAPGVFTVAETTGEKIHINEDILNNLRLDDMSDDEALELLLESGAIELEGLMPRDASLSFAIALSSNNDHYDEYARAKKEDEGFSQWSNLVERVPEKSHIQDNMATELGKDGNEVEGIISRASKSFDSLACSESNFGRDSGKKIKVDIKFSDNSTNRRYDNAHRGIGKHIRARDLPYVQV
ncbi:hypothetical protein QZH41_005722 [Actinostola sp. cb2023]|nr:hypothetical protein QZH41_005722 [Actinostola sp. cb2023]